MESGSLLEIDLRNTLFNPCGKNEIPKTKNNFIIEKWWSLSREILRLKNDPIDDYNTSKYLLKKQLLKTVSREMISDVPIGALLSGGVDSSLIVCLMKEISEKQINTFTVGFEDMNFNESIFAKSITSRLNTKHNELFVTSKKALDVVPNLPNIYDEPFADSSQIPTFLISQFASCKVKAILSGDGGDELFAGYNRHHVAPIILKKISNNSSFLNSLLSGFLKFFTNYYINVLFRKFDFLISKKYRNLLTQDKLQILSRCILNSKSLEDFYISMISKCDNPLLFLTNTSQTIDFFKKKFYEEKLELEITEKIMYFDTISYLTDDIMVKVDRATMHNSLESRAPFLDHDVIELAWKINSDLKINNNHPKAILKDILKDYLPSDLFERPKQGFSIPLAKWLRGPLKEWADDLLSKKSIKNANYFNFKEINQSWNNHITHKMDNHEFLWGVLMFQSWLNKYH